MMLRLAMLGLAVLPSAVSCTRASGEAKHGGRTAREWIADMADDRVKAVDARMALEAMGRPAVPALIAAASHENEQVREGVALVLAEIGGPGAAGALARMVESDARFMNRFYAAGALSKLTAAGDPEARDAVAALIPKLAATLESAQGEAGHDAASILGRFGEPARGTLMARLAHPRPEVRVRAILALDDLKTGVVPALAKAADDPAREVRAAAVIVLGKLAMWEEPGSADGIPVIKRKLEDADPFVRSAAQDALKNALKHATAQ